MRSPWALTRNYLPLNNALAHAYVHFYTPNCSHLLPCTCPHTHRTSCTPFPRSEKWKSHTMTKFSAQRIKELTSINQSLSTLSNCVSALLSKGKKHVPYRNSKLTRMLQVLSLPRPFTHMQLIASTHTPIDPHSGQPRRQYTDYVCCYRVACVCKHRGNAVNAAICHPSDACSD